MEPSNETWEPKRLTGASGALTAAVIGTVIPFFYVLSLYRIFMDAQGRQGAGLQFFLVWFWAGQFACVIGFGLGIYALVRVWQAGAAADREDEQLRWSTIVFTIILGLIAMLGNVLIPAALWSLWAGLQGIGK